MLPLFTEGDAHSHYPLSLLSDVGCVCVQVSRLFEPFDDQEARLIVFTFFLSGFFFFSIKCRLFELIDGVHARHPAVPGKTAQGNLFFSFLFFYFFFKLRYARNPPLHITPSTRYKKKPKNAQPPTWKIGYFSAHYFWRKIELPSIAKWIGVNSSMLWQRFCCCFFFTEINSKSGPSHRAFRSKTWDAIGPWNRRKRAELQLPKVEVSKTLNQLLKNVSV